MVLCSAGLAKIATLDSRNRKSRIKSISSLSYLFSFEIDFARSQQAILQGQNLKNDVTRMIIQLVCVTSNKYTFDSGQISSVRDF